MTYLLVWHNGILCLHISVYVHAWVLLMYTLAIQSIVHISNDIIQTHNCSSCTQKLYKQDLSTSLFKWAVQKDLWWLSRGPLSILMTISFSSSREPALYQNHRTLNSCISSHHKLVHLIASRQSYAHWQQLLLIICTLAAITLN